MIKHFSRIYFTSEGTPQLLTLFTCFEIGPKHLLYLKVLFNAVVF